MFPIEENELDDRLVVIQSAKNKNEKTLIIKSYGLPMVFWGYLAAALIVLFFMFIAVKDSLLKMLNGTDSINIAIAYMVLALFILGPVIMLGFFFYEKSISKKGNLLTVTNKVFWIPYLRKTYELKSPDSFIVSHYMSSPNVAKMKKDPALRGFENKGYFELWMTLSSDKNILLDRHSRKIDLQRMTELMGKF